MASTFSRSTLVALHARQRLKQMTALLVSAKMHKMSKDEKKPSSASVPGHDTKQKLLLAPPLKSAPSTNTSREELLLLNSFTHR